MKRLERGYDNSLGFWTWGREASSFFDIYKLLQLVRIVTVIEEKFFIRLDVVESVESYSVVCVHDHYSCTTVGILGMVDESHYVTDTSGVDDLIFI